jgi:hypothetical protein
MDEASHKHPPSESFSNYAGWDRQHIYENVLRKLGCDLVVRATRRLQIVRGEGESNLLGSWLSWNALLLTSRLAHRTEDNARGLSIREGVVALRRTLPDRDARSRANSHTVGRK